ncbi:mediator of RNA polymerase II transcription subunit 30 isoform X2 [Archocentrus centrarchus]|uniref:mediator of RNA polymerase II transcription subunit 30 isoform X2 n=1 Tax=Archocentrus centrarchus TaxID=63155 RepID=UPI0011EA3119|nr:mediator of RNA polymerase II transcription subunit 30 isoform X2 [Archocentrus centrarchus]
MTTPPLVSPFGGPPQQQQQQQVQAARDVNTASLCRIGQETVQDIVLRTMEIFQLLRNMQLPNGVTYHPNTHQDRLGKLQEHLRTLSVLFRKLRLVYDKCNENCAGLDPIPPEQLIPFVEDDGSKHEDRSGGQSRSASEERREILEVNKSGGCLCINHILGCTASRGAALGQVPCSQSCIPAKGILCSFQWKQAWYMCLSFSKHVMKTYDLLICNCPILHFSAFCPLLLKKQARLF